jgi:hypothetical protein
MNPTFQPRTTETPLSDTVVISVLSTPRFSAIVPIRQSDDVYDSLEGHPGFVLNPAGPDITQLPYLT